MYTATVFDCFNTMVVVVYAVTICANPRVINTSFTPMPKKALIRAVEEKTQLRGNSSSIKC